MYQFWQIHVTTEIQQVNITTGSDGLNDKVRQQSNLGPMKILPLVTCTLKEKHQFLVGCNIILKINENTPFGWL